MECSKVRLKLNEYINGRLDFETKAIIDDHIKGCRVCKEELSNIIELDEVLNTDYKISLSENFTSSIMNLITKEDKKSRNKIYFKNAIYNFGISLALTGMLMLALNIPYVNNVFLKYKDYMNYKICTVNLQIGDARNIFDNYLKILID